ncbi:uncharacterized protein J4E79_009628 [Alternaria viburni]|uniref:uncharacterized protein n=1 Tax=Alternaria viburni TaxID=566460 RepID=UPI0020C44546|nr:uncharacterized protein J4E79_009628 [Alternaria viburni]KAI4649783.1 hypothetical protein J4E79_009628 [Alternaria viburni]
MTSTTGGLFFKDQFGILFETPDESVPYMQFWLKKVDTEGVQGDWMAVLAYDKECELGEYSLDIFKMHIGSYTHLDYDDPNAEKAPIQAFTEFLRMYVSLYVKRVEKEAKGFMEAINEVEDSLNSNQRHSSLLRSLNTISRRIRTASLESRIVFGIDAANWVDDISGPRIYRKLLSVLPSLARDMEQYHPDRLREVTAEVHQHIEDVIAERQQERQEKLQELEDVRREEERELLQQNLEIAKATQRDSRLMSGVAWITMAFLPATFVSSFFGMNFFNGIAGKVPFDEASRSVWLFFAIAIPISALVLSTFYIWNEQQRKKDGHILDEAKATSHDNDTTAKSTGNNLERSALPRR